MMICSQAEPKQRGISGTAVLVILLGFVVRVYSWYYIPLVNPDGCLYIQQAKAFHYGLWDSVTNCYHYLSSYPILIAASYEIFGDWVIAAKSVSLLFGTATLIPMHCLLRRFFNDTVSSLALLIFALLPAFAELSSFIIRGPVYWFFSVLGMYLFILQTEKRDDLLILFSSISFIMGTWARIEGALFILVSICYLLIIKQEERKPRLFVFLLPLLCLSLPAGGYMLIFSRESLTLFDSRILTMPVNVVIGYQELREQLDCLTEQNPAGISPYFISRIRSLIWLIALGTLCVQITETFFYFFLPVFLYGVAGSGKRIRKDCRLIYLSLLSVAAFVLLYAQIIYNWVMVSRFAALFIFPAYVFTGFGLEKTAESLANRLNREKPAVYTIICLLILLIALPKTLGASYEKDKLLFKEIGQFISHREGHSRETTVAGSFKRVSLIYFYANLDYPGAPCFDEASMLNRETMADLRFIKERFDYFIWDEKNMSRRILDRILGEAYIQLKEWESPKLGRLILFKVRK